MGRAIPLQVGALGAIQKRGRKLQKKRECADGTTGAEAYMSIPNGKKVS